MITNNIINGETRVRFYAITNNGKQKRMLADWCIYDTEQLIHSTCGMCAGLWTSYKRGRVECYAVDGDTEKLIHSSSWLH